MFSYAAGTSPSDYGVLNFYGNGIENIRFDADGNLIILRSSAYLLTRKITTGSASLSGTLIGQWVVPSGSSISGEVIPRLATTTRVGGISVGFGLSVTTQGRLGVNTEELAGLITPPIATTEELGGIIVGSGLSITEDGVLSVPGMFDEFPVGSASPGPKELPERSIRGFSAYNSTDFPGTYYSGISVIGPSGVHSGQIAFNWNSEEAAPAGLYYRANDDTGNPNAWSAWKMVGDAKIYYYGIVGATAWSDTGGSGAQDFAGNYGDVFPPAGTSMSKLMLFIPSIRAIYYNGDVDNNDAIFCVHEILSDRIRVYCFNTEQRGAPSFNFASIWSL
jgi:hypothetical protein